MSEHHLKTWPSYFQSVLDGIKTFEVRKADRDFQTGDCLHLKEWCPIQERYTGRAVLRRVEYTLYGGQFGIEEGHVVMGISNDIELSSLRAELERLRNPWMPIETAPKDGEVILLYKGDERYSGPFTITGFWTTEGQWWPCAGAYEVKPTHWQPLPKAPARKQEGEV